MIKLRQNQTFVAGLPGLPKLLCSVDRIEGDQIWATVTNGLWEIGFDLATGQATEQGTHPRALPHALAVCVLYTGSFADCPEGMDRVDYAAERLQQGWTFANDPPHPSKIEPEDDGIPY